MKIIRLTQELTYKCNLNKNVIQKNKKFKHHIHKRYAVKDYIFGEI